MQNRPQSSRFHRFFLFFFFQNAPQSLQVLSGSIQIIPNLTYSPRPNIVKHFTGSKSVPLKSSTNNMPKAKPTRFGSPFPLRPPERKPTPYAILKEFYHPTRRHNTQRCLDSSSSSGCSIILACTYFIISDGSPTKCAITDLLTRIWIVDTTATYHTTNTMDDFCSYLPIELISDPKALNARDRTKYAYEADQDVLNRDLNPVRGAGTILLREPWFNRPSEWPATNLTTVLYIPDAPSNRLSVKLLLNDGFFSKQDNKTLKIGVGETWMDLF